MSELGNKVVFLGFSDRSGKVDSPTLLLGEIGEVKEVFSNHVNVLFDKVYIALYDDEYEVVDQVEYLNY